MFLASSLASGTAIRLTERLAEDASGSEAIDPPLKSIILYDIRLYYVIVYCIVLNYEIYSILYYILEIALGTCLSLAAAFPCPARAPAARPAGMERLSSSVEPIVQSRRQNAHPYDVSCGVYCGVAHCVRSLLSSSPLISTRGLTRHRHHGSRSDTLFKQSHVC